MIAVISQKIIALLRIAVRENNILLAFSMLQLLKIVFTFGKASQSISLLLTSKRWFSPFSNKTKLRISQGGRRITAVFGRTSQTYSMRRNVFLAALWQLWDSLWVFPKKSKTRRSPRKKRRSQDWSEDLKIDQNLRDQIEHSDIKLSKLVNTTENICYFWILAFDYIAILTTVSRVTTVAETTWCHYKAENDKNSPLIMSSQQVSCVC